MAAKTRLQAARVERDWKQSYVLAELKRLARRHRMTVAEDASLKTMLSRWENGHAIPDTDYRRLFRELYGRTDEELGFTDEPGTVSLDDPTDELRHRLAAATTVDAGLVALLAQQTDHLRVMDRQLGAPALMEQMRGHVAHLDDLLSHAVRSAERVPLAAILSDAAALAGWQAIDLGAFGMAWRHHETAKAAAREASSAALLAHAAAQQAYVLAELDQPLSAVALAQETRQAAVGAVPALLQAWLWAVQGELAAIAGDRDACLRAFDAAEKSLPADPTDPELPYIVLNPTHLARWRGSALSRLGDTEATDYLYTALAGTDATFTRARAGLHTDLAYAHAAAGDHDQARVQLDQARVLAHRVGSARQRRRIEQLTLRH